MEGGEGGEGKNERLWEGINERNDKAKLKEDQQKGERRLVYRNV